MVQVFSRYFAKRQVEIISNVFIDVSSEPAANFWEENMMGKRFQHVELSII